MRVSPRLGSGKPRGLGGGQKLPGFASPGGAPGAVSVQETESALVRGAARLLGDGVTGYRLAGGRQPLFPLAWVVRDRIELSTFRFSGGLSS
jgi:hypothetical protein